MSKCPKCGREPKRSTEHNRRYWALLAELSDRLPVQGVTYSRESWHKYFAGKYLGMKTIKLPNGKELELPNSTADLDKGEFHDYATKVEVWAAERNIWLEE